MPSKPTDIDTMNIAISEDRTATLTGINYDDLRSILTAASLYRHDNPVKINPLEGGNMDEIIHKNNVASLAWSLHQRMILDVLESRMSDAISPKYSNGRSKVESAKRSFEYEIKYIDETVKEAELKAASGAKIADPMKDSLDMLQSALRQADNALAKLKHIRKP